MDRRIRTHSERSLGRAICPAPTLLAVLLLATIVPGAAAYAVLERDTALRTTLREMPRRDEARELSVRVVSGLAGAITRTVESARVALVGVEGRLVSIERPSSPVRAASEVGRSVGSGVRLALLNLPPPLV